MIRLLVYFVVVLALGAGFAWLADRPGAVTITWQGQLIETSLTVAAVAIASLVAAVLAVWQLVRAVLALPFLLSRHIRTRKRDRGYQALSAGLIAFGAGDAATARRMTGQAARLLDAGQEPLIPMLDAETALLEGDHAVARTKFEAMRDIPATRTLGLRGLYIEACRLGALEAARQYAGEATEADPRLAWAAEAMIGFRSVEGDWDGAIRLLDRQGVNRSIDRETAARQRAVLLTARAMERLERGDVAGGRADGLEAGRLAPGLAPAALIAAEALLRENNLRKAARILERSWKTGPHPDVAEAYVRARSGDSTRDRLKRARTLERLRPNHAESLAAVARAALTARDFPLARRKAEAAARMRSNESAFLLLADIEETETGDLGRVRHWLAQAVKASPDAAWIADGHVSERWAAVSPVTGRLDAFEWRVPVKPLVRPVEDMRAERAIESLPPLARDADAEQVGADGGTPEALAEVSANPHPPKTTEAGADADTASRGTENVVFEAASRGATHIVTDAVATGAKKPGKALARPPDDPGVKKAS